MSGVLPFGGLEKWDTESFVRGYHSRFCPRCRSHAIDYYIYIIRAKRRVLYVLTGVWTQGQIMLDARMIENRVIVILSLIISYSDCIYTYV